MNEAIKELLIQREDLKKQIKDLEKQIFSIDTVIGKIKGTPKPDTLRKNATNSVFYMEKIRRILANHPIGMSTKDIHHSICVMNDENINYNTFRSYLNRMKENKILRLNTNKKWKLNE